ncbi:hypothetical protein ACFVXE_07915 [Streptomyces sp. NPDC058231]|uniref:hypothetical protein n=1 Tax=Streptomyces sp. NPDC058231 TaxID=3346392 RepID=UPI0036EF45CA
MRSPARLVTGAAAAALATAALGLSAAAPSAFAGDREQLEISPTSAAPGTTVTAATTACGNDAKATGDANSLEAGTFGLASDTRKEVVVGTFTVPKKTDSGPYSVDVSCENGKGATGTLQVKAAKSTEDDVSGDDDPGTQRDTPSLDDLTSGVGSLLGNQVPFGLDNPGGNESGRDTGNGSGRDTGRDSGNGNGRDSGRDTGNGNGNGRDTGRDTGNGGHSNGNGNGRDSGRDTGNGNGRDTGNGGHGTGNGNGNGNGRDTGNGGHGTGNGNGNGNGRDTGNGGRGTGNGNGLDSGGGSGRDGSALPSSPSGHVNTGVGGSVRPDTTQIAAGVGVLAASAVGGAWLLRRRASGTQADS